MMDDGAGVQVLPIRGLPEIRTGDDLAALLAAAVLAPPVNGLQDGDVLVVTHKIVAKAEGCIVDLRTVEPSPFARMIAERWDKDARQVEVVLRETVRIVRMGHGVVICETRHGFVCANAGVDRSNAGAAETVLTLPVDPDRSARAIRDGVGRQTDRQVAVVVSDTFGQAWRQGLVNVAIGCAGMRPLRDERDRVDAQGYTLRASVLSVADEVAAAAEMVMGKLERIPAAVVRGVVYERGEGSARELVRPPEQDLFR